MVLHLLAFPPPETVWQCFGDDDECNVLIRSILFEDVDSVEVLKEDEGLHFFSDRFYKLWCNILSVGTKGLESRSHLVRSSDLCVKCARCGARRNSSVGIGGHGKGLALFKSI